jgi:hypothetical protein
MVVDTDLLRRARESGARLADAAHQVELAKADYHHAVRLLHFAGASMREIAEALELSHQRVHQIIEATGGSGGWKATKPSGEPACTSCGRGKHDVAKLVAGPKVFLCDRCVALAHDTAEVGSLESCSFCADAPGHLVELPEVRICAGCLRLCDEVLAATRST